MNGSTGSLDMNSEYLHQRKAGNSQKWNELSEYIWKPKTKEILGKTKARWGITIAFYTWFYFCMLLLLLVCLLFFSLALDDITPTMTSQSSPIQNLPGLAIRPAPDFETSLIRFIQGKPSTYKPYTDHLQSFLQQYENEEQVGENFIDCSLGRPPGSENKVCRFDVNRLGGRCTWQKDFGYDEGQPCVIVKMNRVYGFLPEPHDENDTSVDEALWSSFHPDYVGVTCRGRYKLDQENIGNITYNPPEGFSKYFYPFLNQEGYRSPLVMVQFNNLTNGIVVNVICEAWAKNITPRRHIHDGLGVVTFSLLVD